MNRIHPSRVVAERYECLKEERLDRAETNRSMKQVERWLLIGNMAKVVGVRPLTTLEKDIVLLVFTEGRAGIYSATGRYTLLGWLAQRLEVDRGDVGKAVRSLVNRGYADRGKGAKGNEYLRLTDDLFRSADRVARRWRIKSIAAELWPEVEVFGIEQAEDRLWDYHYDAVVDGGRALKTAIDEVLLHICRTNQSLKSRRQAGRILIDKGGSAWVPSNVRELSQYRKQFAAKQA